MFPAASDIVILAPCACERNGTGEPVASDEWRVASAEKGEDRRWKIENGRRLGAKVFAFVAAAF